MMMSFNPCVAGASTGIPMILSVRPATLEDALTSENKRGIDTRGRDEKDARS